MYQVRFNPVGLYVIQYEVIGTDSCIQRRCLNGNVRTRMEGNRPRAAVSGPKLIPELPDGSRMGDAHFDLEWKNPTIVLLSPSPPGARRCQRFVVIAHDLGTSVGLSSSMTSRSPRSRID